MLCFQNVANVSLKSEIYPEQNCKVTDSPAALLNCKGRVTIPVAW